MDLRLRQVGAGATSLTDTCPGMPEKMPARGPPNHAAYWPLVGRRPCVWAKHSAFLEATELRCPPPRRCERQHGGTPCVGCWQLAGSSCVLGHYGTNLLGLRFMPLFSDSSTHRVPEADRTEDEVLADGKVPLQVM
eukprot:s1051_g7.t1